MIQLFMHERSSSRYKSNSLGKRSVLWFALLLGISVCILLNACHNAHRQQTPRTARTQPVLSATPNPVPAGDPDQPLGSTTIAWDTGDGSPGDVYVKVDREPEVFMARAPSGQHEVRWIQFDSVYEFRLYAKKRTKLLAKLEVTRDD
jgi:hypothetical protein